MMMLSIYSEYNKSSVKEAGTLKPPVTVIPSIDNDVNDVNFNK